MSIRSVWFFFPLLPFPKLQHFSGVTPLEFACQYFLNRWISALLSVLPVESRDCLWNGLVFSAHTLWLPGLHLKVPCAHIRSSRLSARIWNWTKTLSPEPFPVPGTAFSLVNGRALLYAHQILPGAGGKEVVFFGVLGSPLGLWLPLAASHRMATLQTSVQWGCTSVQNCILKKGKRSNYKTIISCVSLQEQCRGRGMVYGWPIYPEASLDGSDPPTLHWLWGTRLVVQPHFTPSLAFSVLLTLLLL